VCDGGDGTVHAFLNAARGRVEPAQLARVVPTNGGTMNVVAGHAGLNGDAEAIVRGLVGFERAGREVPVCAVPTLELTGTEADGDAALSRVGFSVALAGIGAGFFHKYYAAGGHGSRAMLEVIAKGAASFMLGTKPLRGVAPQAALEYGETVRAAIDADVTVDDAPLPWLTYTAFAAGAIPINLGNLIRVFEKSGPGALHVIAGEISDLGIVANLPRMFRGRSLQNPDLFSNTARHVRAVAHGEPFRPVFDGEYLPALRQLELRPGPAITVPAFDATRWR
jgi:hypothetical protein